MSTRCFVTLVLAAAIGFVAYAPLGADDKKSPEAKPKKKTFKPIDIEAEIINVDVKDPQTQEFMKSFTFKLEKDLTYEICSRRTLAATSAWRRRTKREKCWQPEPANPRRLSTNRTKNEECQIGVLSRNTGKFTLSIRDPSESMILTVKDKLDKDDKILDNKHHKVFFVELEEGKGYQFDMKSKVVDSYLILQSPDGKEVAKDDDSGGDRDARFTTRPAQRESTRSSPRIMKNRPRRMANSATSPSPSARRAAPPHGKGQRRQVM